MKLNQDEKKELPHFSCYIEGHKFFLTKDYDMSKDLIDAYDMVKKIASIKGVLFVNSKNKGLGEYIYCSQYIEIGILILWIKSNPIRSLKYSEQYYIINPVIEILYTEVEKLKKNIFKLNYRIKDNKIIIHVLDFTGGIKRDLTGDIENLNQFINNIREIFISPNFKEKYNNFNRPLNKNLKNINKFIDTILSIYPVLLASYFEMHIKTQLKEKGKKTNDQCKEEESIIIQKLDKFMQNWQKDDDFFKTVGYIVKIDYTEVSGYRFRLILLSCNLKKSIQMQVNAKLKTRWRNITNNEGDLINYDSYSIDDRSVGSGIVKKEAPDTVFKLKQGVGYLVKFDYFVRYKLLNNGRSLRKGFKKIVQT